MRRSLVFLSVLLVASLGCTRARSPLVLHETASFPAASDKLVQLDLGSIDAEVTVAGTSTITVETDLEVHASSPAAARIWIERHKPEILDAPALLSVRPPTTRKGLYLATFHETRARVIVTLPATCRLEITTSSGDVRLSGATPLGTPVRITTSSGDLRVDGGTRALVVHTSSGDSRLDGQPLDTLELESSSGDLRLRSGAARVAVETSSGDITADELTGSLSVRSSSGDVVATWRSLQNGSKIEVLTSSGDVTLRPPESAQLRGELATSSGSLHCDLPCTRGRHSCTITGAEGSSQIAVTTSSGDVKVTVRGHQREPADERDESPESPGPTTPDQAPGTPAPPEAAPPR